MTPLGVLRLAGEGRGHRWILCLPMSEWLSWWWCIWSRCVGVPVTSYAARMDIAIERLSVYLGSSRNVENKHRRRYHPSCSVSAHC
ncbi:hypothetical protein F5141DRAFT_1135194 [Pisolithus sp. B1]|nr:hypothetical protein F5141DRAFT_1135194 [Pisolithus sp. B1]